MDATLQPQKHEEIEGQGSDTQEPVSLHLPIIAAAENQADVETEIQEEVVTQEPTPSQSAAEVAIGELQGEDVVTQEPISPEVVSEAPMVEVSVGEIQGRGVVKQEPAPPKLISEVSMQAIQDVQIGTPDDKVWTQLHQKFVNLDSNNEEHAEDEEIQRLTK